MRWPDREAWTNAASLDVLKATPFNCVLLKWTSDSKDRLGPLLEAGRRAGLILAGWIAAGAGQAAAIAGAKAAGLSAALVEDPAAASDPFVIPVTERSKLPWSGASPVLAMNDAVWPSVKTGSGGDADAADAGPTGLPWIDSNGWFVKLARARAPGKAVWLASEPPKRNARLGPEVYLLAVAEAAAYGARWIASVEDQLWSGLGARDQQALEHWKKIGGAAGFFESHKEWLDYRPSGVLGVLSDFSGDNEFLATEILNLLSRRQLQYVILEKTAALSKSFDEIKAILYVDSAPPADELRAKLQSFVRPGGLLICPRGSDGLAAGPQPSGETHPRFDVRAVGRGRIAVAKEDFGDPYVLAADTHVLLSRRRDLVRLWNPGATNAHYTVSPDNKHGLVQILNYAHRPTDSLSLRVMRPYQRASLWTLESAKAQPVKMIADSESVEFHLPPVSVYAAIELGGERK